MSAPSNTTPSSKPPPPTVLAVDLGIRMGLARFNADGHLLQYRSHNLGNLKRLKRAAPRLVDASDRYIFAEGDRNLFEIWKRVAERRQIESRLVPAEIWRRDVLLLRQHRNGRSAKQSADLMARRTIAWSGAPKPTSLRHDAAEAILLGLWAVLELGWIDRLPDDLRTGL